MTITTTTNYPYSVGHKIEVQRVPTWAHPSLTPRAALYEAFAFAVASYDVFQRRS